MALNSSSSSDREHFMDALRGFAILGIFIANLASFTWYDPKAQITSEWLLPDLDYKFRFAQTWLIEGKFYSIFSLLFGWGFALQMNKIEKRGLSSDYFMKRRLWFMLLLGLIHLIVFFYGDIVAFYAMLGFVLFAFRHWPTKRLVVVGVSFLFLPVLLYYLKMNFPIVNKPRDFLLSIGQQLDQDLLNAKNSEDFNKIILGDSWMRVLIFNFDGLFYRFQDLFFQSRIFKVLGMFLIGFALGRSGYFKTLLADRRMLWRIALIGLAVGLPCNYMFAYYHIVIGKYYQLTLEGLYQTMYYAFGVAPLAMAYVALLALAFQSDVGRGILMKLSPVGKMAFTNYVSHSIIGGVVFLGIGLGLGGAVGPAWWTAFALCVFVGQIILSTIWLRFFEMGPLEWIWRCLTYGKLQPLLRRVNSTDTYLSESK